jgi:mRNA interferase RelE/StbE
MYTIEFLSGLKTAKIPQHDYLRIRERIILLTQDPRPRWSEKMKNRKSYRIAVGNYRVLYSVDDDKKKIIIQAIGHRRDIYRS